MSIVLPTDENLKKAKMILEKGGIIAYPTETFYALGANPFNIDAVKKLFKIKERSPDKPVSILIRNVEAFLKKGGHAMIAIKSRSIDVTKDPKKIFQESLVLIKNKMKILDYVTLDPYEGDHAFIVCRSRS